MNATPTAVSPNFRLNRIKIVSRLAKYVCVAILIYSIGFRSLFFSGHPLQNPFVLIVLVVLLQTGLWLWHRKMTRLPGFHDRSKLNIVMVLAQIILWVWYGNALWSSGFHTLRNLSSFLFFIALMLWYWNLSRLFHFYEHGRIFTAETIRCLKILGLLCVLGWALNLFVESLPVSPLPSHASPPGAVITHRTVSRLGFFSIDFGTGINFGMLFAGVTVVLIAWIMDEGRKIKEEQELTV